MPQNWNKISNTIRTTTINHQCAAPQNQKFIRFTKINQNTTPYLITGLISVLAKKMGIYVVLGRIIKNIWEIRDNNNKNKKFLSNQQGMTTTTIDDGGGAAAAAVE